MKCQNLFSVKNKTKYIADNLHEMPKLVFSGINKKNILKPRLLKNLPREC